MNETEVMDASVSADLENKVTYLKHMILKILWLLLSLFLSEQFLLLNTVLVPPHLSPHTDTA